LVEARVVEREAFAGEEMTAQLQVFTLIAEVRVELIVLQRDPGDSDQERDQEENDEQATIAAGLIHGRGAYRQFAGMS
jgi:hypothetical protein